MRRYETAQKHSSWQKKPISLPAGKTRLTIRTMAAAYAESWPFPNEAIAALNAPCRSLLPSKNFALARNLGEDLAFYRNNLPLHPG